MRQIATHQVVSTAPPAAFEPQWERKERLAFAHVVTRYDAAPDGTGGTCVSASVAIGGLLQGVWSMALGPRIAAGLPGALAREVRAIEAEAA